MMPSLGCRMPIQTAITAKRDRDEQPDERDLDGGTEPIA